MSVDATIVCGSDFTRTVQVHQPDGTAFDLTGFACSASLTIGWVVVPLVCSIVDAAGGVVQIDLAKGQTALLHSPDWGEIQLVATQGAGRQPVGIYTIRTEPQVVP